MLKYRFALEKGQPKRLEVDLRLRDLGAIVVLDGRKICSIKNQKTFRNGINAPLPDGSSLHMVLHGLLIEIDRDGEPIPGSSNHPDRLRAVIAIVLFYIGTMEIVFESIFLNTSDPQYIFAPFGELSILAGLVYVLLAILVFFQVRWSYYLTLGFSLVEGGCFLILLNPITLSHFMNIGLSRIAIVVTMISLLQPSKKQGKEIDPANP